MIPPILHYVWLGGKPLNELGQRCLASWQKHLPGWQIKRWDETNSPMEHPYVMAMMKRGLVAFASDYIRLHVLYVMGGVYFDTDVELVRDIRSLLVKPVVLSFSSMQNKVKKNCIGSAFLSASPRHPWIRQYMNIYEHKKTATLTDPIKSLRHLYKQAPPNMEYYEFGDFRIYHSEYFNPPPNGQGGFAVSQRTVAVHHSTGQWGGAADPPSWFRRVMDLRLDRKVLRPLEQACKGLLRKRKKN